LPFFNLTLAFNTGAAYSFLHNASGWQNSLLTSLAVIVSACIVYWLSQLSARAYWAVIALTLVLGGALGNAWDRLLYGHVVDFLDFHLGGWHFAIFNIADSAICVGAFMLIVEWLFIRYQPGV
jgi:signal peptidase II